MLVQVDLYPDTPLLIPKNRVRSVNPGCFVEPRSDNRSARLTAYMQPVFVVYFQRRQPIPGSRWTVTGLRRMVIGGRVIRRWIHHATRQIDHLPGIDQARVLDLRVGSQDVTPAHAEAAGDFSERISPLHHVRAPGWRVVTGIICLACWDIEHLSCVHPPAKPRVCPLNGVDRRAALLRYTAQGISPLDCDIAGTARPGGG